MKTIVLTILAIVMTILCTHSSHAGIRCGNDIISVGDSMAQVVMKLSKCGKVLDKNVVSTETTINRDDTSDGDKIKKKKVTEIWFIRVSERGGMYCYPLTFEEGFLKSIGDWSQCD